MPDCLIASRVLVPFRKVIEIGAAGYRAKFNDHTKKESLPMRILLFAPRVIIICADMTLFSRQSSLAKNLNKRVRQIESDFEKVNRKPLRKDKPLCTYFVSSHDHNGALLSKMARYEHLANIRRLRKHYDVNAKVVQSTSGLFGHLAQLKAKYQNKNIQCVYINAHGDSKSLSLPNFFSFHRLDSNNGFRYCSEDATIILNACSVSKGEGSIAERIAKSNAGKTVIGPNQNSCGGDAIFDRKGKIQEFLFLGEGIIDLFMMRLSKKWLFTLKQV